LCLVPTKKSVLSWEVPVKALRTKIYPSSMPSCHPNNDGYLTGRHKRACRHLYKVLDWKPNYKHVFPECLKAYQSHLFDNAVSFAKCRELTALFKKHQALVLPGTLSTLVLRNDVTKNNLEWFIDAQCRLIDMNNFEDTREVDFDADFGERDDEEDYEKLTLSQLIATPSVPPLIRKGEAFEAFRSLYGDVCNHVHKVDEGIRKLFDEHFGALRRDILRYQKKTATTNMVGASSFPGIETAPKRVRKRPPSSPSNRRRKRNWMLCIYTSSEVIYLMRELFKPQELIITRAAQEVHIMLRKLRNKYILHQILHDLNATQAAQEHL
jgi:hypothetical protein